MESGQQGDRKRSAGGWKRHGDRGTGRRLEQIGRRWGTRGGVGGKNRGRIGTSRQMFSFYAYTVPFLN